MNKREVFQWLVDQNCEIRPKEGINNTFPPVEVINKTNKRYSYFALYPYTDEVSRNAIEKLVRDLGIEPPKGF